MRAHVLCPSVTCAVHSANRTHCAGHVGFHTPARVENPSSPNPATQPGFCPSVGSATSTAGGPGPGLTPAAEHVGVSCVARPGPHARCCANPARSPMQLQQLPGLCLSVAVVVSTLSTHTCVLQHSDSIPLHSHSPRETRLHAHACPPSSPLHTATSHTLFSLHSVAHSHTVPHSHTAVRTRVPFPAHMRLHSHVVLHSHTECWEARILAHSPPHHSHTGFLPYTGSHSHSGFLAHAGLHPYTVSLSHTTLHPRYACVAARISPRS